MCAVLPIHRIGVKIGTMPRCAAEKRPITKSQAAVLTLPRGLAWLARQRSGPSGSVFGGLSNHPAPAVHRRGTKRGRRREVPRNCYDLRTYVARMFDYNKFIFGC